MSDTIEQKITIVESTNPSIIGIGFNRRFLARPDQDLGREREDGDMILMMSKQMGIDIAKVILKRFAPHLIVSGRG